MYITNSTPSVSTVLWELLPAISVLLNLGLRQHLVRLGFLIPNFLLSIRYTEFFDFCARGTPFHFKEFLEGRGHLGFSRTRFTSDPPSAKGYHIDPSQGFSRKYILGTREPGTAVFSSRGGILIRGGFYWDTFSRRHHNPHLLANPACLPYNKRNTFCKWYGFDTE